MVTAHTKEKSMYSNIPRISDDCRLAHQMEDGFREDPAGIPVCFTNVFLHINIHNTDFYTQVSLEGYSHFWPMSLTNNSIILL